MWRAVGQPGAAPVHRTCRASVAPTAPRAPRGTLALSELVSNAVQAGADWIDVHLIVGPSEVQVQVHDSAPGWPLSTHADQSAVHGRGMRIVAAIADAWGFHIAADDSKVVWASFNPAAAPPRCAYLDPARRPCPEEAHATYQAMLQQISQHTGLPPEMPLCAQHGRQLGWLLLRRVRDTTSRTRDLET